MSRMVGTVMGNRLGYNFSVYNWATMANSASFPQAGWGLSVVSAKVLGSKGRYGSFHVWITRMDDR